MPASRGRPPSDRSPDLEEPEDAYDIQVWPDGNFPPAVLESALKSISFDVKKKPLFVRGWFNHTDKSALNFVNHCADANLHLNSVKLLVKGLYGQQAFDELWPNQPRHPSYSGQGYHHNPGNGGNRPDLPTRMEQTMDRLMEKRLEYQLMGDVISGITKNDQPAHHTDRRQFVPVMRRKVPVRQADGSVIEVVEEVEMPFGHPAFGGMGQQMMQSDPTTQTAALIAALAPIIRPPVDGEGKQVDPFTAMEKMAKTFKDITTAGKNDDGNGNAEWMHAWRESEKQRYEENREHWMQMAGMARADAEGLARRVHELDSQVNKPFEQRVGEIASTYNAMKSMVGGGEVTPEERKNEFDFKVRQWEQEKEDGRTDRIIGAVQSIVEKPINAVANAVGDKVADYAIKTIEGGDEESGGPSKEEAAELDKAYAEAQRELTMLKGGEVEQTPRAPAENLPRSPERNYPETIQDEGIVDEFPHLKTSKRNRADEFSSKGRGGSGFGF